MWEKVKEMAFNLWGVTTCLFILSHLILIEIYGSVVIYEDCAFIRYTEMGIVSLFLCLGIERIIKACRR